MDGLHGRRVGSALTTYGVVAYMLRPWRGPSMAGSSPDRLGACRTRDAGGQAPAALIWLALCRWPRSCGWSSSGAYALLVAFVYEKTGIATIRSIVTFYAGVVDGSATPDAPTILESWARDAAERVAICGRRLGDVERPDAHLVIGFTDVAERVAIAGHRIARRSDDPLSAPKFFGLGAPPSGCGRSATSGTAQICRSVEGEGRPSSLPESRLLPDRRLPQGRRHVISVSFGRLSTARARPDASVRPSRGAGDGRRARCGPVDPENPHLSAEVCERARRETFARASMLCSFRPTPSCRSGRRRSAPG